MSKAALLVIDVQKDVVNGAHHLDSVVSNINSLISQARASHVPVIWVQHSDDYLVRNSDGWEFVDDLKPSSNEIRIYKTEASSFVNTPLQDELTKLGVDRLVITGAQSEYCVSATTQNAIELGYKVSLVSDAHTTVDGEEGSALEIIQTRNERFAENLIEAGEVSFSE
jgi:nicotinamidase-related amidase